MERFRIGDRIRIIHKGKEDRQVYIVLDILEDYGSNAYWLRGETGRMMLESETPETVFEKIAQAEAQYQH